MEPAAKDGDRLTIEPADAATVRPGEIATFLDEGGRVVTHRVLGREEAGDGQVIVTQGDGRTVPDPAWSADRLVGRVTAVDRPPRRLGARLLRGERLAWWELAEIAVARLQRVRCLRRAQRRLFPVQAAIRTERRTASTGEWLALTSTAAAGTGAPAGWVTVVREGPDPETRTAAVAALRPAGPPPLPRAGDRPAPARGGRWGGGAGGGRPHVRVRPPRQPPLGRAVHRVRVADGGAAGRDGPGSRAGRVPVLRQGRMTTPAEAVAAALRANTLEVTHLAEGSGVVIHVPTLRSRRINPSGMALLGALDGGVSTVTELAGRLVAAHGADRAAAEADVEAFLGALAAMLEEPA